MHIDLSNKTAVITGGSSGIGLAAAELFLEADANVAICGRDTTKLDEVKNRLVGAHDETRILCCSCDVLNRDEVEAFASEVGKKFGGVDMLINNAGQARVSTFSSTTEEEWREELELKFFSIIHCSKVFLQLLEESTIGSIVCTGSLLAKQPEPHLLATSAARAGQLSLIHGMAKELADKNIRVNTVLVGQVESDQWRKRFEALEDKQISWEKYKSDIAVKAGVPLGRMGTPKEAATAIFFLATPMSSFTTGSTIDVSGGLARHVG